MNTIHLHGALKREFGGPFRLDVRNPAEAVVALSRLHPRFEERIRAGEWRVVRGNLKNGRDLSELELGINLPGQMHLLPAPRGRKKGGGAKIVIGALLVVFAVAVAFTGLGAALGFSAASGSSTAAAGASLGFGATANLGLGISVSAGQIGMMGLAMMFSGVSQMLAPQPKATTGQDPKASFLFGGQVNPTEQGVPVPLLLGQGVVGGVIIHLGIDTIDVG